MGVWIGWGWLVRASPTLTTSPGADPMSRSARALARQAVPGSYWSLLDNGPRLGQSTLLTVSLSVSSVQRLCTSCKQYSLPQVWERSTIRTDSVKGAEGLVAAFAAESAVKGLRVVLVHQDGKGAYHQDTGKAARFGKRAGKCVTYRGGERTWSGFGDDSGSGLGVRRCAASVCGRSLSPRDWRAHPRHGRSRRVSANIGWDVSRNCRARDATGSSRAPVAILPPRSWTELRSKCPSTDRLASGAASPSPPSIPTNSYRRQLGTFASWRFSGQRTIRRHNRPGWHPAVDGMTVPWGPHDSQPK